MKKSSKVKWRKELRTFVYWYLGAFVAGFIAMFITLWVYVKSPQEAWRFWKMSVPIALPQLLTYIQPLVVYLLFVLVRSLVRNFQKRRWRGLSRGFALKVLLPVFLIWSSIRIIDVYRYGESFDYTWDASVENQQQRIQNLYAIDGKHRGMHLFDLEDDSTDLALLNTQNVEWLTFVPYIGQNVYNEPPEYAGIDSSWTQRRFKNMQHRMEMLAPYGFKVMLKPHIWLQQTPDGTWRSDIAMNSEAEWETWFDFYTEYMLMYASMAEQLGFEMLCVGTELHATVAQQPERWKTLISQIKEAYSGKLVYAANWSDNLEEVSFWEEMDYIGIQAYYPIAEGSNPELGELEDGWKAHATTLQELSEQYNKPILFTEIGYKSTTDAATRPWEWVQPSHRFYKRVSHKTQALSYQAFFNVIWPEPWFAGAILWQWNPGSNSDGKNNRFTIKGKPALNVVAGGFSQPVYP